MAGAKSRRSQGVPLEQQFYPLSERQLPYLYQANQQQPQMSKQPPSQQIQHAVPAGYPSTMYRKIGPAIDAPQYIVAQSNGYNGPQVANAPSTPFDTAYGATLLPSHMLLGSPFFSTPTMTQHRHKQRAFNPTATPTRLPYSSTSRDGSTDFTTREVGKMQRTAKKALQPNRPLTMRFQVLPRGDDKYRTRSLLFEKVAESIDLHTFITKFVRNRPIESIYLIKSNEDNSEQSFLLSFFSKERCLDFYNNVLQRLSEFKGLLKSADLTLNFVALEYLLKGNDDSDETISSEEDSYLTDLTMNPSLLEYNIIGRGATRSIAVEFKDPCSDINTLLHEQLAFLSSSKNKRYILESLDLVNARESSRFFPKDYALLTFLNVEMAIDVLDYLRREQQKHKVSRCYFVSRSPVTQEVSNSKRSSVVSLQSNEYGNTSSRPVSTLSLSPMKSYNTDSNEEIDLEPKLQSTDLQEFRILITREKYPEPHMQLHDDHIPDVKVSEEASLDMNLGLPTPQDINWNNGLALTNLSNRMMSNLHLNQYPQAASFSYNDILATRTNSFPLPISQSLKQKMSTSAEVASSMGGGAGNRTIYIGNIHPRSKVEDICNVVRGGILQQIKFIKSKHICFVTFIDASGAAQFYANSYIDPIVLHGNVLKIGWGDYSGALPKQIALAVTAGASRNVYVSLPDYAFKDKYLNDPEFRDLHEKYSLPKEEQLREDFGHYGAIEQINYLADGHCCWVNFMNIRYAIQLVEELNSNNGEKFHKAFSGRYKGLVIGYGKDRCGNINKSLVAGKNSKFYRKVKRPSSSIKLKKLEAERHKNEEKQRASKNPTLHLESLGIQLIPSSQKDTTDEHGDKSGHYDSYLSSDLRTPPFYKSVSQDEIKAIGATNGDVSPLEGYAHNAKQQDKKITLGIGVPNDNEENLGDNDNCSSISNASTDIELIIESPMEEKYVNAKSIASTRDKKMDLPHITNDSLNVPPPITPSTISKNYKFYKEKNKQHDPTQYAINNKEFITQNEGHTFRKNKKRNRKTIPGSDVMSQYLTQVQHSTFMYAANILGASDDTSDFVDGI